MVVLTAETEVHDLLVVAAAVVAVVYTAATVVKEATRVLTPVRQLLVTAAAAAAAGIFMTAPAHTGALVVPVIKAYASSVFRLDSKEENNG